MLCAQARVSPCVHMCTGVCASRTCTHVWAEHACMPVCECAVGPCEQSLGTSNGSSAHLPCLCASRAADGKLLSGRADFVAWLHMRVSTWVCFN